MACQLEIGRLGWMEEASQLVLAIICYIVCVFENIKFRSISTMGLCLVLIFKQIPEVFWWTCGLQILRPISWDANWQQSHFSSLYKPFLGSPTALLLKMCKKNGDVWDPLEIGKLKPRWIEISEPPHFVGGTGTYFTYIYWQQPLGFSKNQGETWCEKKGPICSGKNEVSIPSKFLGPWQVFLGRYCKERGKFFLCAWKMWKETRNDLRVSIRIPWNSAVCFWQKVFLEGLFAWIL